MQENNLYRYKSVRWGMYGLLIVDDAEYVCDMLKDMLDPAKYEVVGTAVDGFEAVRKYRELKPDLITMDLVMKERDGINAIRDIRELDQDVPILVISALGRGELVDVAMEAGANGYLWKPFTVKNLSNMLESLLGESK